MGIGLTYAKEIRVEATGGQHTCVPLPVPFRGILSRLIVKQLSGPLEGFSFNLYDRHDACSGVPEESVSPDDGISLIDPDLHKLQNTQTVSAGQAISQQYGMALYFHNRDEQRHDARRASSTIYLDLLPAGSGAKTFGIAWTAASQE